MKLETAIISRWVGSFSLLNSYYCRSCTIRPHSRHNRVTHLLMYNINTPSKYLQTILFTIALSSFSLRKFPPPLWSKISNSFWQFADDETETEIIYKDFCLFCLKKWSVKPQRSSLFALLIMPSSALRHERVITKWKRRPLLTCVFSKYWRQ